MKNVILQVLVLLLTCATATAQEPDHVGGGYFKKTVSHSRHMGDKEQPAYILDEKSVADKIFFGFTNSPVEFTFGSIGAMSGLKLYKTHADSLWRLEIIPVGSYSADIAAIHDETAQIEIPYKYFNWLKTGSTEEPHIEIVSELHKSLPEEVLKKIEEQNVQAYRAEHDEKTYTSRRPETTIFTVDRLGDMLYERTVSLIGGFKAEGGQGMFEDGYSVKFRCEVGDELWTLNIHEPQNLAEQMAHLYMRIIDETSINAPFDEEKYIAELESLDIKPIAR